LVVAQAVDLLHDRVRERQFIPARLGTDPLV
jgi:hypothetical protein